MASHAHENFTANFIASQIAALEQLNVGAFEEVVSVLRQVRERGGRIFFAGSGGGAGHSSHAAADFRRLAGIESYAIGDNLSELTALINDESWQEAYKLSLAQSNFSSNDGLFVFSVGGGDEVSKVSLNLVSAINYAYDIGGAVVGVSSEPGGHLRSRSDACVLVPVSSESLRTPTVEGIQAVAWHLLVSHPLLQIRAPKWESIIGGEPL